MNERVKIKAGEAKSQLLGSHLERRGEREREREREREKERERKRRRKRKSTINQKAREFCY